MQEALQKPIIYYEPKGSGGPAGRQVYFAAARIDSHRNRSEPPRLFITPTWLIIFRSHASCRSDVPIVCITKASCGNPMVPQTPACGNVPCAASTAQDFHAILSAGSAISPQLSADGVLQDSMIDPLEGLAEHQAPYRREIPASGNRKWRDPLFRTAVLRAYRSRLRLYRFENHQWRRSRRG